MTTEQVALLELVKVGVTGEYLGCVDMFDADWSQLFELACKQSVVCVTWHGIEILYKYDVDKCPQEVKLQWYARSRRVMAIANKHVENAAAFAEAVSPIRLALLKGIDYARYWPVKTWREFGDLDVVVVDENSELKVESSRLLDEKCTQLGYYVDDHDYKHTEIRCNGMMVENHHFFTCFGGSKVARVLEEELRKLFRAKSCECREVSKYASPSLEFTSVFMIAHAQNHFFYEGMNLRQILDWYFFLQKEGENVDWFRVKPILEKTGLKTFAVLLTQICNKFCNLRCNVFAADLTCDDELEEKFLCDIFSDKYNSERKLLPMLGRLANRFVRTIKFNKLNKMSIVNSVWRWLAFTSYLNRRPEME